MSRLASSPFIKTRERNVQYVGISRVKRQIGYGAIGDSIANVNVSPSRSTIRGEPERANIGTKRVSVAASIGGCEGQGRDCGAKVSAVIIGPRWTGSGEEVIGSPNI